MFSRIAQMLIKKKKKSSKATGSKSTKGSKSSKSGHYPSYRKQPASGIWKVIKRFILKVVFYGGATVALFLMILSFTLPSIDDLNKFTKAPSILIKSEDGQIIGSFGDIYGDYVPYVELPTSLIDAVIATEDRNFRYHFGIDPLGLLRATIANIRAHHVVQGGSTITQQVAKNVFLTPEHSMIRKIKEMLLAVKLERRFSKEDIMSIYLNRVYLGAGSYGVDAAAKRYFGKSARDLTLSESAIMAGLLKAPSRYAPTSNPELSRARADQVLVNMEDAGYLTKKESGHARSELSKAMSGKKRSSQSALYFADWIADQLPEYVGNVEDDLVVTATLRPDLQAFGEKAINDVMDKDGVRLKASQAALLSMSPDGAVRVMIGGRSYAESQYNRVTQAQRQPGSAFKMFVYLAGMESGLTPDTIMEDKPITLPIAGGTWTPKNYTGKYEGAMTLKQALTESINSIAVQVSEQVGREKVISVARRLGLSGDMDPVPSIALGATEVTLLELTSAYAHLAANGAIVYPYGIVDITTSRGKQIYHRQGGASGMVLGANVVGMMNEMLMSVVTSGTGRGAAIGRPVAGKTGTTSDYKDAWFVGYTPDLVTGVWVGNDDNTPMKKVTGGSLPAPIWRGFMSSALAGVPVSNLPTGGGWLSHLPWNADSAPSEQRPVDTALPDPSLLHSVPTQAPVSVSGAQMEEEQPQLQPQSQVNEPALPVHHDLRLGKSFWDKLNGAR